VPEHRIGVLLTAVTAAVALTGCSGGGSAPQSTDSKSTARGTAITISGFAFSPATLEVKAGQQVTVTNEDSAAHTLTADDGSFDSKDLAKGQSYTFTAGKPGTYSYLCDIHQYMKGTIKVVQP
jgi:plastocyanin